MEKKWFLFGLCGFFASFGCVVEANNGLGGCSASMHVSEAQICSLDDHFNVETTPSLCLGDVKGSSSQEHFKSLYASIEPGLHMGGEGTRVGFDTFEGYAFDEVPEDHHGYWMVIDEKNSELHADQITEADPHRF